MAGSAPQDAASFVPSGADLAELRSAAASCRGCELYRHATQTVFGDGHADAKIVLLGEMPGDREDREGEPFVGPAGRILAKGLEEAGIDRSTSYVTNVVKHFKFSERGKRRIHETPNRTEIVACRPWLVAELNVLQPEVLVCLGATAAKALFGSSFRITRERGTLLPAPDLAGVRWADGDAPVVVATVHPSAVLRSDDREEMFGGFLTDMRVAAEALT